MTTAAAKAASSVLPRLPREVSCATEQPAEVALVSSSAAPAVPVDFDRVLAPRFVASPSSPAGSELSSPNYGMERP